MWSLAILISSYTALAVGQADDGIEKEHVNIEWEQIDTTGVSVNTNEGFGHEANETDTPHLSVQVNFGESGDENEKGVTENEENYKDDGVNDIYLPLDPFTLHHPFIRPEVTEFEYSDWYFLFFSPATKTSSSPIDISSASPEIAASLSSKLSVPSSMFSINSLDKYKSKSISANLSLMSHSIPKLHHNLCNLQNKSPIFWIRGTEFRLVQIFHDKNQHLYINNKQSSTSPMDSLGLLITLILGGLGMFLLVLAVTFLAAKTIAKNDFERFNDLEDILVEQEEFLDVSEHSKDIFIIDDGENSGYFSDSVKNPVLTEMTKETNVPKSSNFLSTLSSSWRNLFGKRLIKLSP
eukprot:TRINITY_DN28439_c0_g1_i1.p1 TRINITY_DN28439_c0_g1~~TRINITY_DN28439_c0_g1_i1.p1  ORF type:complete len:351 (-),score=100.90 TRINITY_DN28439_c0_g1_i1:47-1099(-)